jgi:hypothetical protein
MVKARTAPTSRWRSGAKKIAFLLIALIGLAVLPARAVLQFDVFLGYEGVVPEASWFPVVCEIKNDGPTFVGVVEVSADRYGESQTRRLVVELPTGTLKRIGIPVFSTARYQSSWDVRLLDERGKVRAEQVNIRPRRQVSAGTLLIGALPRTATGVPVLRTTAARDSEFQPAATRLQTSLLPDNPLVFEGLDVIYLNSEKAAELNPHQVEALLTWLNEGGHLIVSIESATDVNGVPWFHSIVPCDLSDSRNVTDHSELQSWLRSGGSGVSASTGANRNRGARNSGASYGSAFSDISDDPNFEKSGIQVMTGTVRNGDVVVSAGDVPLIITSRQGRGRVTTLMFSPEREPFKDWNNLPSFWSRITEVPPELYLAANNNNNIQRGGWSIDGVFGAMVDSKQVRKLPVHYLLLLLIVYLLVIGPVDQYWLKRIRRPMLTWITFPCYVVIFSLLIYFIGYRLRAGETEWNELHLVDVFSKGEGAELRGRTYASVYSPVNATYRVESREEFSAFRGEFQSAFNGGGDESEHAEVMQNGDNYKASIFVPVWTSQLYVSDWLEPSATPLKLDVASDGSDYTVTVQNLLDHPLTDARVAVGNRIIDLGELPANQKKTFKLTREQGSPLSDYVHRYGQGFQSAANQRQHAFGATGGGQIEDLPDSSMAISFISNLSEERFITPPGLDLSPLLTQGNAVLLAWESDYSPIKPINQFNTRRSHKDTLWRIAAPVVNSSP